MNRIVAFLFSLLIITSYFHRGVEAAGMQYVPFDYNLLANMGNSYINGMLSAAELSRRTAEVEFIRTQTELLKQQRQEEYNNKINEVYDLGLKKGYSVGYENATQNAIEYIKKEQVNMQVATISTLGAVVFKTTSIDELKKNKNVSENILKDYPDAYYFKVLVTLIDKRLQELGEIQGKSLIK